MPRELMLQNSSIIDVSYVFAYSTQRLLKNSFKIAQWLLYRKAPEKEIELRLSFVSGSGS